MAETLQGFLLQNQPCGFTMSTQTQFALTDAQKQQYRQEGYIFLERVVAEETLEMLRTECDQLVEAQNTEMDRLGSDTLNLSRRGSRYFIFLPYKDRPQLGSFIFSDTMEEICRATLGENALFFWEQFVVKQTRDAKKSVFSWHQDAGYVDGLPVPPYVNAWVALDDVSEENGTLYVLPYSKAGTRERIEHRVDPDSGDRVGYFGEEPGIPFIAPAGSICVFSSTAFHRSGPNQTDRQRRAYALQYSADTVYNADGSVMGIGEPFIVEGNRIR